MKKILYCFIVLSLSINWESASQSCLPGENLFTTQASIDNFPINNPGCTEIEGQVFIQGDDITNLDGFQGVKSIGNDLVIGQVLGSYPLNPGLTSLKGLDSLTQVGGDLIIDYNQNLETLEGLENLTIVGEKLFVLNNDALVSLEALQSLSMVGDMISIVFNSSLIDLQGLGDGNLHTVNADFFISGNLALQSLSGLDSIQLIQGTLLLLNNPLLSSVDGLEQLTTVNGNLSFTTNAELQSLQGLENLTTVEGTLSFRENNSLNSLNGLEGLTSVGWFLSIRDNQQLTSIDALQNLQSIDGELLISGNTSLATLEGLSNLSPNSIDKLTIHSCPNLSDCATATICNYLSGNNDAEVYDNSFGCSSINEVLDACNQVSTKEFNKDELVVSIFPNPTVDIIYIQDDSGTKWSYCIKDVVGNTVIPQNILRGGQVDVRDLAHGLYILELNNQERIEVVHFIKQ